MAATATSSEPFNWLSMQTRLNISFQMPPCRSQRPFCHGDSSAAELVSTPCHDNCLANAPMNSLPRSHQSLCGMPAQLDQQAQNALSTFSEEGIPSAGPR